MEVIKPGILDSFQDSGRYGYAHLGVSVGGCMDKLAGRLANLLVGNTETEAVLEMHFPAPLLYFNEEIEFALTGADFCAKVGGRVVPQNRRIILPAGSTLSFENKIWGQRCYLGIAGGWALTKELGSYSTHLKAGFGGWQGRRLKKGDSIPLRQHSNYHAQAPIISRWFIYPDLFYKPGPVRVIAGIEWHWLTKNAKKDLQNHPFAISRQSDRMGYHLSGKLLEKTVNTELLSSGVLAGTVQLLPNGNPLLLMADCQTTGGYPRILQVADVDLPKLAQMGAGESFTFSLISTEESMGLLQTFHKQIVSLSGAIPIK